MHALVFETSAKAATSSIKSLALGAVIDRLAGAPHAIMVLGESSVSSGDEGVVKFPWCADELATSSYSTRYLVAGVRPVALSVAGWPPLYSHKIPALNLRKHQLTLP